jgi:hypothetical protein
MRHDVPVRPEDYDDIDESTIEDEDALHAYAVAQGRSRRLAG